MVRTWGAPSNASAGTVVMRLAVKSLQAKNIVSGWSVMHQPQKKTATNMPSKTNSHVLQAGQPVECSLCDVCYHVVVQRPEHSFQSVNTQLNQGRFQHILTYSPCSLEAPVKILAGRWLILLFPRFLEAAK